MIEHPIGGFAAVDESADPEFFIRYLDARKAVPQNMAIKRRILQRLEPLEGKTVLDLGCGTGDDAREIARFVGSSGHVTGIDYSERMIAEARRRNPSTLAVDFRAGNAMRLEFPDSCFDRVRARNVLMYLSDPTRALQEMARVLRAGGRIVVSEFDIGTHFIDFSDVELTQRILALRVAANPSGCVGRALPRLFRKLGLKEVEVETAVTHPPAHMVAALLADHVSSCVHRGFISQEEAARWRSYFEDGQATGDYYGGGVVFTVSGIKG